MFSIWSGLIVSTVLLLSYWFLKCIYRLFFHPLSKYPGPFLAKISQVWYVKTWTGGRWPFVLEKLHRKYGRIVRIAPNELSFSSPQSLKDIYGTSTKNKKYFLKSGLFYDRGELTDLIFEMNPEKHAAMAKAYQPAFRPKALRDQEHVIHKYADMWVEQLLRLSKLDGSINMVHAFEWIVFDIIGDLLFGEPFGAVESGKHSHWISILLKAAYGASALAVIKRLPVIKYMAPSLRDAIELEAEHERLTAIKVRDRIKLGDSNHREDLLSHIVNNNLRTEQQLAQETPSLIAAGADTTAHTLVAAAYHLTRYPECLRKLQAEVDGAFESYDGITADAVATLPYLNAVLDETMRIFPPVPIGLPRVSPGEFIDGVYVPKGVHVSTDIMSLHRDPKSAPSPLTFDPDRWLGKDGQQKPFTAPFSVGPRSCIGVNLAWMEMRIVLAKLIYSCQWEFARDPGDWVNDSHLSALWQKPAAYFYVTSRFAGQVKDM